MAAMIVVPDSVGRPAALLPRERGPQPIEFIEHVVRNGCPRFLFSSSAAIYGPGEDLSVDEDSPLDPLQPVRPDQGDGRAAAGRLHRPRTTCGCSRCATSTRSGPTRSCAPACSSPRPTHLLGKLLTAVELDEEFQLTGVDWPTRDGSAIRDYIHVWDLAEAHVAALRRFDEVFAPGVRPYQVINLATGSGTTVKEFVAAFREVERRAAAGTGDRPATGRRHRLLLARRTGPGNCSAGRRGSPSPTASATRSGGPRSGRSASAPESGLRSAQLSMVGSADPLPACAQSVGASAVDSRRGRSGGSVARAARRPARSRAGRSARPGAGGGQRGGDGGLVDRPSGGVQARRRTESGAIRFSGGRLCVGGQPGHHLAAAGQPGGRDRVALGPAVRRRRTVGRRRLGQVGVGQLAGRLERVQPDRGPSRRTERPPYPGSANSAASSFGSFSAAAMIAMSGSTRPGALSRRDAIRSRAYHSARTRASARAPRTLWMPDVRRHGSGRGGATRPAEATSAANSSWAQSSLPCSDSSASSLSRSATSSSTSSAA